MRTPPLCQLWQLQETGPGTYSIVDLMNMHEAMDMEATMRQRQHRADEARRSKR